MSNFYVVIDNYLFERENVMEYLESVLEEVGLDPYQEATYWNAWPSQYAKAEEVSEEEYQTYREEFIQGIETDEPAIILALGNNAGVLTELLKKATGINKVRGKATDYHGSKIIASISPAAVLREPVNEDDFKADIRLAAEGSKTYEYEIIDITCPEDIDELEASAKRTGVCAYDWETTDKDPVTAEPTTCAFCTGERRNGKILVWFWMRLDKLVPCFSDKIEAKFKKRWGQFFKQGGDTFHLIAHNSKFDDWITERYIGFKIQGSTYDTQILKWSYNNVRPHGLKPTVAKYLGVSEYDAGIDEVFKETKARRGKNLTDKDDLYVLKWLGIEPETITKTLKSGQVNVTHKWPTDLDKGICGFAMIERDTIRLYNSLDALYTLLLWEWFYPKIVEEGLGESCELRHIIGREMLRAEQRGLPLDVEINREFEAHLVEYERVTHLEIIKALENIPGIRESIVLSEQRKTEESEKPYKPVDPDDWIRDFNANSPDQIILALFGSLGKVPVLNRKGLIRQGFTETSVNTICDDIEEEAYGDYVEVRDLLRSNEFDYASAKKFITELFREKVSDSKIRLDFEDKTLGLGGLQYDPVSFSKKTGKCGTGKVSLLLLQNQKETDFVNLILMYRKVTKMKTSFIDKIFRTLDSEGLSRTSYNITGTDSARISSSGNYNAQNWAKYIRGQLRPRPGYILFSADAKAVEVRVLAAYSQDAGLLEAIYAEDTHKTVASIIFKIPKDQVTSDQRKAGKITVFLTLYGGGAEKLSKFLNITKSEAQKIINDFLAQFPDIARWIKGQHELAATYPYRVYTAFGTRRSTKNILSDDQETKARFERISSNSPIQGSAGELCLYIGHQVMEECRRVGYNDYCADENLVWFVITVHDEITFEVHESICWAEEFEVEEKNKETGEYETVIKKRYAGPFVELFERVIAVPCPFPPLDTVRFDFDYPIEDDSHLYWAQRPDLKKALESSSNPDEKFCWPLILAGLRDGIDLEEVKEVEDEF